MSAEPLYDFFNNLLLTTDFRIGPLILLIFFGMLIFGFVYVYIAIPEVKGLSLEEVDELYRAGVKPWNSSGWRPADWHERAKMQGGDSKVGGSGDVEAVEVRDEDKESDEKQ